MAKRNKTNSKATKGKKGTKVSAKAKKPVKTQKKGIKAPAKTPVKTTRRASSVKKGASSSSTKSLNEPPFVTINKLFNLKHGNSANSKNK